MVELQEPLWERQKSESSKAFCLFTLYRDLGPARILAEVPPKYKELTNKTIGIDQVNKYSMQRAWVKRATAYDDYQDRLLQIEHEKAIKEMAERHANDSTTLQNEVLKVKEDPKFKELTPTQKAWVLNTTVHSYSKIALLERLSRGESTNKTVVEADVTGDITSENVFDHVDKILKHVEKGNQDGDQQV